MTSLPSVNRHSSFSNLRRELLSFPSVSSSLSSLLFPVNKIQPGLLILDNNAIKIGILVNPIQDNTQKIETLRNRVGNKGRHNFDQKETFKNVQACAQFLVLGLSYSKCLSPYFLYSDQ
jgi:hypothetical protein